MFLALELKWSEHSGFSYPESVWFSWKSNLKTSELFTPLILHMRKLTCRRVKCFCLKVMKWKLCGFFLCLELDLLNSNSVSFALVGLVLSCSSVKVTENLVSCPPSGLYGNHMSCVAASRPEILSFKGSAVSWFVLPPECFTVRKISAHPCDKNTVQNWLHCPV